MANEPHSSSWHPALMPNGVPDPRASEVDKTPQSPAESLPEPLDQNTEDDPESHGFTHTDDGHHAAETSFSNDGDAEGGAGLASEEPESSHHIPENDPEVPAPAENQHAQETTGRNAPTTAQHSSSMSFARTVSHEVPFNDDDDGDWSLSRTDSDPFKFMPQSDRTNSFPVVPPIGGDLENHHDGYLPPNQALDVLEETERDYDAEEEEYQAEGNNEAGSTEFDGSKPSRARHAPSRSIGGEVQWSEAVASEARYEEGVPLMAHPSDSLESAAGDGHVGGGFVGSFDDHENDDFFNQTHEAGMDTGDHLQPLQRKSTMQVLAAMDAEPLSYHTTLDETLEENDEEQDDEATTVGAKDTTQHNRNPSNQDITSKWQEAFASDDEDADFLLDDSTAENKELDAAAFLGSDDEGLLDDVEESQPTPAISLPNNSVPSTTYGSNAYVPAQQHTLAYRPATTQIAPSSYTPSHPSAPLNGPQYGQTPQLPSEPPKAQSFADKSKGGYASPYDLPTDLVATTVKPRKRASMQQLPRDTQTLPPPRSASMTRAGTSPSSEFPPPAQAPNQKPAAPPLRNKGSFFEDLPIAAKPRPSSRQSHRAASPSPYPPLSQSPHGPSPLSPPIANQVSPIPGPAIIPDTTASPAMNLVAPPRVSPYASLQPSHPPLPPPSGSVSRYSPAPPQTASSHSAPPPVATSRYSPAPPAARPTNSYNPSLPTSASQPILPHLPRTSSPLAHFEISSEKAHGINGDVSHPERRASSSYEPRMNRVSSLPPTREVEEEEDDESPNTGKFSAPYSPPPSAPSQSILSPKRPGSSYAHQAPSAQPGFVPPPRAQTQSPGATRGGRHLSRSSDSSRRPVSAHSPTSPVLAKSPNAPHGHPRTSSLTMNMIAPTDGREHDPLQRWQGVPIISWGVGGTIVTSFPKSIPRYVMNQTTPSMLRASGEVKVRNIKDIEPLQDRLAKFPGPLKGKSKKKEVLTWLAAGIEGLEKDLPDVSFHPQLSLEAKRAIERLLLWKLLRVFIEFDGVLEGTPAVDKTVRDILSPGTTTPTSDGNALFPSDSSIGIHGATVTSMQADSADSGTMEQIRNHLLKGDSEAAVWLAVDKRLWGHAMLISHTVSSDLYKRVAQEFVRKEVNHPGHSNESLAALYKIFSGNYDDCVDELVPVHARAGLQLVSTQSTSGLTNDTIDGLDKWRETLTLVLSNRSTDDIRGLNALGKLLSSYGRAEAAHICFIFSRHLSIFGGMDDPNVDYVLLGSDHHQQYHQVARDTEALQLSEVYEYGLSLSGAPSVAAGAPHLAAYKLHHAVTLAENGFRDKALQYCDAIATAMTSQTKRSPYHHTILETAVDDFMTRLKQAPKEESSSWMSKPSMNKVSDSMWNRFNKFVAGDEQDANGNGSGDADNGPFARIGTPSMSRSPSVSNFEAFGVGSPPSYATSAPIATLGMSSRYAPAATQPAGIPSSYDSSSPYLPSSFSQTGRNSNEYSSSPYESPYLGTNSTVQNGGYTPSNYGYQAAESSPGKETQPAAMGYQPYGFQDSNAPSQQVSPEAAPGLSSQGYQPESVSYGYEPPKIAPIAVETESNDKENQTSSGGYEPPSFQPYGYEPPSYQPDLEPSTEDGDDVPKKKSFMDDDEDDIPALKPNEKSKSERDRENDEMFRKAAEEDAKRAAAQQQAKKGWGFSSWFGGGKKEAGNIGEPTPNKPIRAKLGEASSFVYDPELKRWVNKKPGAENAEPKTATPPPPRSAPRSVSGTPPPMSATPPPLAGRSTVPPPSTIGGLAPPPTLHRAISQESLGGGAPTMMRSVSGNSAAGGPPSRPPSRPTTSMSNASSIDDLLSTSAPRKPGQKKPRKSGRYVDVMAK